MPCNVEEEMSIPLKELIESCWKVRRGLKSNNNSINSSMPLLSKYVIR